MRPGTSQAPSGPSVVAVGSAASTPPPKSSRRPRRRRRQLEEPSALRDEHGHIVLKIGGSEAGSCRSRESGSGLSSLSAASGLTLDYEALERRLLQALQEAQPEQEYKSVVSVDGEEGTATPIAPSVFTTPSVSSAPPLPPIHPQPPAIQLDPLPETPPIVPESSDKGRTRQREMDPPLPFFLPPSRLPYPHLHRFNGVPGPMTCATSGGNVEMTGWRTLGPAGPMDDDRRRLLPNRQRRELPESVLTAEDLPRLYPGPAPVPPWTHQDLLGLDDPEDSNDKACLSQTLVIRVFIGVISAIGVACLFTGIGLGATSVHGTTRLTLCLLMIGVGAVLVGVSGLAWRLTSLDNGSGVCCGLLRRRRRGRSIPVFPPPHRPPPYFGLGTRQRPMGLGGGFPDFPWQPPPPSYQASVRDQQLMQLVPRWVNCGRGRPVLGSPPPTYRAESRRSQRPPLSASGVLERPPSYRSEESLATVVVEERPFSRQDDPAAIDDTLVLIRHETPPAQQGSYTTQIAVAAEDVSVIDCSSATPVGLRMPQDQGEIRRSLGRASGARIADTDPHTYV